MVGEMWLDGIVSEEAWRSQNRRPLVICPEPNGSGYEHRQRDMRLLLRNERGKFCLRLARLLRLFFGTGTEDQNPLLRCAFIDLSKRSAGSNASRNRIAEATHLHSHKLAQQIQSINPTHILVAGKPARAAFDQYLRTLVEPGVVAIAYVPHPMARVSNKKYKQKVLEAVSSGSRNARRRERRKTT